MRDRLLKGCPFPFWRPTLERFKAAKRSFKIVKLGNLEAPLDTGVDAPKNVQEHQTSHARNLALLKPSPDLGSVRMTQNGTLLRTIAHPSAPDSWRHSTRQVEQNRTQWNTSAARQNETE